MSAQRSVGVVPYTKLWSTFRRFLCETVSASNLPLRVTNRLVYALAIFSILVEAAIDIYGILLLPLGHRAGLGSWNESVRLTNHTSSLSLSS